VVQVGPATVTARELAHPGGALGFRVDHEGSSVVYATDFEHGCGGDDALRELAAGADVLIYDATYTPAEYRGHRGWGHSTWADGVKAARAAGVKKLVLFHHDPAHDDTAIDEILRDARAKFPDTEAAREGRTIVLGHAEPRRTTRPRTAAKRSTKR
jgi:ribonuclease BN (tRNA processing enzyme)